MRAEDVDDVSDGAAVLRTLRMGETAGVGARTRSADGERSIEAAEVDPGVMSTASPSSLKACSEGGGVQISIGYDWLVPMNDVRTVSGQGEPR